MAELIEIDEHLQALIADPGPVARRGAIVRDEAEQSVPNEAVRRRAQETLGQVRRDWARLTGEAT